MPALPGPAANAAQPLPHAVGAMAARRALGPLRATFPRKPRKVNAIAAMVCAGIPFLVLAGAADKPWIALVAAVPCWTYAGIALPLSPFVNRRLRTQCVYLFEGGVAFVGGTRPPVVLRWADIAIVAETRAEAGGVVRYSYWVYDYQGNDTAISPKWRDHVVLGSFVADRVAEHLLPGARATLAAGRTLQFRGIVLSAAGLVRNGYLVPWPEIRQLRLLTVTMNGTGAIWIQILQHHKKLPLVAERMNRFPNVPLLRTLYTELTRHHPER